MMRTIYFTLLLILFPVAGFSQSFTDPVDEKVRLYPNPAKETLWIEVENKNIRKEHISIYNIIGNKLDLEINNVSEKKFSVIVNNLPPGYYLLVVENNDVQFTKTLKFLKAS